MAEQLREKIAKRLVQYNYDNIAITERTNKTGDYTEANEVDDKFVADLLALIKEAGYVKLPPDSAILRGISNLKNIGDTQSE